MLVIEGNLGFMSAGCTEVAAATLTSGCTGAQRGDTRQAELEPCVVGVLALVRYRVLAEGARRCVAGPSPLDSLGVRRRVARPSSLYRFLLRFTRGADCVETAASN